MIHKRFSRREFLLLSSAAMASTAFSCASSPKRQATKITYPMLAGDKIQSPEHYGIDGCMTGIYTGNHLEIKPEILRYEKLTDQKPTYFMLPFQGFSGVTTGITTRSINQINECASLGVIPFITYWVGDDDHCPADLKGIIEGKYDAKIQWAAKDLKNMGEKYGGFFIRLMERMNARGLASWCTTPSYKIVKMAWWKVWKIFEAEGTNRYATWVFNPYVPAYGIASGFYPGHKYVDWVGISAFNADGYFNNTHRAKMYELFQYGYSHMFKAYGGKPIMICETGMHQLKYKPQWISEVFHNVKEICKGIKALSWSSTQWQSASTVYMDMRIDSSPESLEAFKKSVSDPYFLGAISYKKN